VILRVCDEAKRRRDAHKAATSPAEKQEPSVVPLSKRRLLDHLEEVIRTAKATGQAAVVPIRHRVQFKLTVLPDRPGAKEGSFVRCWLPFPQEYRQQDDVRLIRTDPEGAVVAPNVVDGKKLGGAPQRTVYLERRIEDPARPVVFEEEFEYVCRAYYPDLSDERARPLAADYDGGCLGERPPHIVFTPEVREAVREVVGDEKNPLARARRIFHFIDREIPWVPEQEYTIIPSFAVKALATRRGDCGIQSTLFITMCRAAGIPARWQSGVETKPGAWSIHDWTEFYVEPWGWLPADPSYGLVSGTDDPAIREFYFGHLDGFRMIVNLDYGAPLHPPKKSLRSEPADFQRGEVEMDGRNLYFDEWEWRLEYEWERVAD
jgi:transglutaminase-like putative cysteine protease